MIDNEDTSNLALSMVQKKKPKKSIRIAEGVNEVKYFGSGMHLAQGEMTSTDTVLKLVLMILSDN